MEVQFRIATFNDVEKIIDLCNECFDESTDLEYAKSEFLKSENDDNQIYIVGLVDEKVVAHSKITIIPTIYGKMGTYSILNHVCVKPEFRRNNIATRMLEFCEEISKQNNCNAIELWSMNFRQPAHECYKSYGFNVEDAKFFSKDLK